MTTQPWTDEERLRSDERSNEQLIKRVNAAIAKRDAARAEAERTNREHFYVYGPDERQERAAQADAELAAFIEEEEADVDSGIAKLEQALADNVARGISPLTWASDEDQIRADRVRANVRRELSRSTVAEVEQQAGLALRGGDWIVARIWSEEIGEMINNLPEGDIRKGSLVASVASLKEAAVPPALAKEAKALTKRLEGQKQGRSKFWDAKRSVHVEAERRVMAARHGGMF